MKYLKSKILKDSCISSVFNLLEKERTISISEAEGSSLEALTAYLSLKYKHLLYISDDEVSLDEIFRNIQAWAKVLNYQGRILRFPYAGIASEYEDSILYADKLKVFFELENHGSSLIVTSDNALNESITGSCVGCIKLKVKDTCLREDLLRKLVEASFERVDYVEKPGEFAARGAVIDIYSFYNNYPVRIELWDDCIEEMRIFKTDTQRMLEKITNYSIIYSEGKGELNLKQKWYKDSLVIYNNHSEESLKSLKSIFVSNKERYSITKKASMNTTFRKAECKLPGLNKLDSFVEWMKKESSLFSSIFICGSTEAELERLSYLIKSVKVRGMIRYIKSDMTQGFLSDHGGYAVMTDREIFDRWQTRINSGRGQRNRSFSVPEKMFNKGDYVVHFSHGIGIYSGVTSVKTDNGVQEEVIEIEYKDNAKLYVPRDQYFLLEKYIGTKESSVKLDRLGSAKWQHKKEDALLAARDYAAKIIRLEAMRSTEKRDPYDLTDEDILTFEQSFPYQETEDQERSIIEVKNDMGKAEPMNRLILGDAGYGKTEVAARAAFIAAYSGKQTAMLAPTTILAEQHFRTFSERMAEYPLSIEVLSRFTSAKDQKRILSSLQDGSADIVIGTHRLVQKDVEFKELGLLIIDEEQRFGVSHKDYLISKHPGIDILTLSATPIPRTLYMSLMGVRNMSAILTPPVERRQIKTKVIQENWHFIKEAVLAEKKRGGQVFFVHNRVKSIEKIKNTMEDYMPEITFGIAHGQLSERELKSVMADFSERKIDCLIATNIIESGLDMPNVNTLFVHRADCFGLAELYQLRGRVGRFNRTAYAYLIISPDKTLDTTARRRVEAIKEFSRPGGGYHIAIKDLEIRGAGNILGVQQSGHIAAIGFDLYCKILRDAVKSLKGEEITPRYEVQLFLGNISSISTDYISSFTERFQLLKRISLCEELEEIDDIANEIKDRFGIMPPSMEDLIESFRLKCLCRKKGIIRVEKVQESILITDYRGNLIKHKYHERKSHSIFSTVIIIIKKLTIIKKDRDLPGWMQIK